MGRRFAFLVGVMAVVAGACSDAGVAPSDTAPPSPPTTGTPLPPSPPPPPPIDSPEWFPRWDEPLLTALPPVGDGYAAMAAGSGGLVVAANDLGGPIAAHFTFSADGATWEPPVSFEGARVERVETGGPGYVAVGGRYVPDDSIEDATRWAPAAWWSADGRSWQEATVEVPADAGVLATFRLADYEIREGSWIADVVFDGEVGLAVGRSAGGARNVIWTSRDGKTWTESEGAGPGGPAHIGSVVAGTTTYLAWGAEDPRGHDPGPVALWRSQDGASWDQVASFDPATGPVPWWHGLAPHGSGYVVLGAVGYGAPVAWVSPDGVDWSGPHPLPAGDGATFSGVASSGDLVLAAGSERLPDGRSTPVMWLSADGIDWAKETPDGDQPESSAWAVDWLDDHWLVLGRAWGLPGGEIAGLAWQGR